MVGEHAFGADNSVTKLAEIFDLFILMPKAEHLARACLSDGYLRNLLLLRLALSKPSSRSSSRGSLIDAIYIMKDVSYILSFLIIDHEVGLSLFWWCLHCGTTKLCQYLHDLLVRR